MLRVLDLFCGGGGAAQGIWEADHGVTIFGVDIEFQKEYPFWFVHADVFKLDLAYLEDFHFIWASPPCFPFSCATLGWRSAGRSWPDLVEPTKHLLRTVGVPFVIENVPAAPIRGDLELCGEMFGNKVIRHRKFEIDGFEVPQPPHIAHRGRVCDGHYVTVAGNGGNYAGHNFTRLNCLEEGSSQLATWQYAMGIDWIKSKTSLAKAVPPSYSRYIFQHFLGR